MRLRYIISKMSLRVKRYSYDKSEILSKLTNNGKKHLADIIEYFDLSDEKDLKIIDLMNYVKFIEKTL